MGSGNEDNVSDLLSTIAKQSNPARIIAETISIGIVSGLQSLSIVPHNFSVSPNCIVSLYY